MEKTTLQVAMNTLERLKLLKNFERQSYDEVLNLLIDNFEEDEVLTEEELNEIKIGLDQIKRGETTSIEKVAKELGITLR
jgi:hypothetical protein